MEPGIATGRPPMQGHARDCHMAGNRRRTVSRDAARRPLTTGLRAYSHYQPHTHLQTIDLLALTKAG